MRYDDSVIKVRGKGNFAGKLHEVTASIPQVESLDEASQFFGGDDGIVSACNSFLSTRAPGNFRSKVANFLKTAVKWDDVVAYANDQVSIVKDYQYSAERGASAKKIVETVRSIDRDALASMDADALRNLLLSLK